MMDALGESSGSDSWEGCVVPEDKGADRVGSLVERVMSLFRYPDKNPAQAETEEEFHTLLGRYVTQVTVVKQLEADFFKSAMGTRSVSNHLETIAADLHRRFKITFNGELLKEESLRDKIDGHVASVLHQGVFADLTSKVATEDIWNPTLNMVICDTTEEEDIQLEALGVEKKIEVIFSKEQGLSVSASHPIAIVNPALDRKVIGYLEANGAYESGSIRTSFRLIDHFEIL